MEEKQSVKQMNEKGCFAQSAKIPCPVCRRSDIFWRLLVHVLFSLIHLRILHRNFWNSHVFWNALGRSYLNIMARIFCRALHAWRRLPWSGMYLITLLSASLASEELWNVCDSSQVTWHRWGADKFNVCRKVFRISAVDGLWLVEKGNTENKTTQKNKGVHWKAFVIFLFESFLRQKNTPTWNRLRY